VPPVPPPILSGKFFDKQNYEIALGRAFRYTARTVARAKRPRIEQTSDNVLSIVRQVQALRSLWQKYATPEHGNVTLGEEDVLVICLAGFFDPQVRSLRTIEQLAAVPAVKRHLQARHVPRSTLSDALDRFRTGNLPLLVRELQKQVPALARIDPDLEKVAGKIVAGDGSLFRLAGEVTWALQRTRNKAGDIDSQVRLNLQVDVQRWTVEDLLVGGREPAGGEPAAMRTMLRGGVLYLFDRGYYAFDLLSAVLEKGSDFVVRLKKDLVVRVQEEKTVCDKDRRAGVLKDQVVYLGVENGCKGKAPDRLLRLVSVWDEKNQQEVRLLSSRLDLEAWVIGLLYRCRWVIELFLRWLKVTAGFAHLISTSANGITLQFYVAMICTLLIHIRTGMPVDKYSLLALGMVAQGRCDYASQLPVLLKRQRERTLEKARLARRKAGQKTGG
jgi:DDE family transposase